MDARKRAVRCCHFSIIVHQSHRFFNLSFKFLVIFVQMQLLHFLFEHYNSFKI